LPLPGISLAASTILILSWFKGAIAGPVIAEGRLKGYWHVVPFFVGGLIGYYGAADLFHVADGLGRQPAQATQKATLPRCQSAVSGSWDFLPFPRLLRALARPR
jgi:hypothetical protein